MVVYPRWRGEHGCWRWHIWQLAGLSPLARGTPFQPLLVSVGVPVYPRWRGEHAFCVRLPHLITGLSPLARGTLRGEYLQRPQERFIPAGAGNTGRGILLNSQTPVYPRWRGEHANGFMRHCAACGLSPLARGTHSLDPP